MGAAMGGLIADSLWMLDWLVVPDPDGAVLTEPTPALVYSGIGFRKASRKAGVPNVSVNATPRT